MTPAPTRFERLDALRGVAIVWMVAFHFAFDLAYFRITRQNFYADPFWTVQRTCILSLFLFVAGAGQAAAYAHGPAGPRWWRRWAQVAGCAVLVSAGSWLMFGPRFISFGVLHAIAAMLLVVRATAGWGRALWAAGALAIALPHLVQHPFFDTRLTDWIGLVTRKPATEDYVPLLPWLGVTWWGVAAGQWLLRHRARWLAGPLPRALRPLAVLGRWSLTVYMLHQPILIGLLLAALALARG
ncbi:MAG TPA: heparan-alpha-glucosaminide N-acetyltransferase [Gemmatimonadales bacterium]|nr:heparan-alpha-glucosaminide N-acetyltransferase [Gemmatimonadales bacterium]